MMACLQFLLRQKIHCSWKHASCLSLSTGTSVRHLKPAISAVAFNKNVRIFQHSTPSPNPRPLVLLFGWLFAKPKHLKKFADIYIHQGFDVILVQVFLKQSFKPKSVQCLMRGVLDLCEHDGRKTQPILVHALSGGGFMYGEALAIFQENPTKYANVSWRLRGQILDSVFPADRLPSGIPRAVNRNKSISNVAELTIKWYWAIFPSNASLYRRFYDALCTNKLRLPSVFLFSNSDPFCDPKLFEAVATEWQASDVYVAFHIWDDAPHVSIYKKQQEEYEKIILDFVRMTGISSTC